MHIMFIGFLFSDINADVFIINRMRSNVLILGILL